MSYEGDPDDDFSPEDAFNLFTPSIYRPGIKDRPDVDFLPPPGGPDSSFFTLDPLSAVTLSAVGGGPPVGAGVVRVQPPPSVLSPGARLNASLSQFVAPTPLGADWILGEREDAILLPIVLSVIGLSAVLGNLLLLLTVAGLRRMRSGPNLMLANVALADIVFVAVTVPVAVVNHATKTRYRRVPSSGYYDDGYDDDVIGPRLCRFVYYIIFVTVYVTVYTLVVSSVFRFFGELLRGGQRSAQASRNLHRSQSDHQRKDKSSLSTVGGLGGQQQDGGEATGSRLQQGAVPLSTCSALVSCAVVWVAFAASHLTFVVQSDVAGLAAFEKPVICVYGPPSAIGDVGGSAGDVSRVRTLWITFLTCAFLLPLTIVCCTSASVLRMQRRAVHRIGGRRRIDMDDDCTGAGRQLGLAGGACGGSVPVEDATVMENMSNDGRSKREMTTIIMTSAIVRAVCWLPLQIFVLIDVFGEEPEPEATADVYRKAEMFGVCMALVGACVGPPIYRVVSNEFRDAFRLVLRRICCCCCRSASGRRSPRHASYVSSRMVFREPSLTTLATSTMASPPSAVGVATPPPVATLHHQSSVEYQRRLMQQRQHSPMSSASSSATCYEHHHQAPHHLLLYQQPQAQQQRQIQQQSHNSFAQQPQLRQHQLVNHAVVGRPQVDSPLPAVGRTSSSEVHETILSIISDSSNHINYA